MPHVTHRRFRRAEEGSALLIVFVLAAMVAIALFMELPDIVFEAQRQKEQLEIDRAGEYVNAIKLFRRKIGRYPNSLKELEDTNRMRFLRRAYADPFTGKADWRLIHVAPTGQLIDSKVNPISLPGQTAANNTGAAQPGVVPTSTAAFPSNTAPGAGPNAVNSANLSPGTASGAADPNAGPSEQAAQPDYATLRRSLRPAPSAGSGASVIPGPVPDANGDGIVNPGDDLANANAQTDGTAATLNANGIAGTNPNGVISDDGSRGVMPLGGPAGRAGFAQVTHGDGMPSSTGAFNGPPAGPNGTSAGLGTLNTGNQATAAPDAKTQAVGAGTGLGGPASSFNSSRSQLGVLNAAGGIGGIATVSSGHSIKLVNNQSNYSLWEFYYDPRKDPTQNSGVQIGQPNGYGTGQPAAGSGFNQAGQTGQNSSQFGSNSSSGSQPAPNGQTSGFGVQSGFAANSRFGSNSNSGFGSTTTNTGTTNQTTSPANSQPQ